MVTSERERCRLTLRGVELGTGVRPFIRRVAETLCLSGFCKRRNRDVVIEVEGERRSILEFRRLLLSEGPSCRVRELMVRPLALKRQRGFSVQGRSPSKPSGEDLCAALLGCFGCSRGPLAREVPVTRPADVAPAGCPHEALPRRGEVSKRDCPLCGANYWLESAFHSTLARGEESLPEAIEVLAAGGTLSVKGPHGYHLLADATCARALERLRTWKDREREPFPVLFHDMAAAREFVDLRPDEEESLRRVEAPIVLARLRDDFAARVLGANVAPGRRRLGVVLASTPFLHALALGLGRPVVMTRASDTEGRTIETDERARRDLYCVDALLMNDGPCGDGRDSSVLQHVSGRKMVLFRARGFAERSYSLDTGSHVLWALGSSCGKALGVAQGGVAKVWPALPQNSRESLAAWAERLAERYGWERAQDPTAIAFDAASPCGVEEEARELAERHGAILVPVSHPEAHVEACRAEHGIGGVANAILLDDGGIGRDGTMWGGEVLRGTAANLERTVRLHPFQVPAIDLCRLDPRMAAACVLHALELEPALSRAVEVLGPTMGQELIARLQEGRDVRVTTSAGVLFEAMATLLLNAGRAAYELEPLWGLSDAFERARPWKVTSERLPVRDGVLDWRPLVRDLLERKRHGESPDQLVARFHAVVLSSFVDQVPEGEPLLLCGSVLRSPAVVETLLRFLEGRDGVHLPENFPPGDPGIALGQLALAAEVLVADSPRCTS